MTAVSRFGEQVGEVLTSTLGADLVGVYFVGSVALGGYVAGESDIDLVAVVESPPTDARKRLVASAVVEASGSCPTRGVEFVLHQRDVVGSSVEGAAFELNVNTGPRMPTVVDLDASAQPGFWFILDRAVARRSGIAITGPPARTTFADVPRRRLLMALLESLAWHSAHERASLHSVLNACRAWRYAEDHVLGSKLEGAAWARGRWSDTTTIDAAVALRGGANGRLDDAAVADLMSFVTTRLQSAAARA